MDRRVAVAAAVGCCYGLLMGAALAIVGLRERHAREIDDAVDATMPLVGR